MAETANLRLNLDSSEFLASLRKVGETTDKVTNKGKRQFKHMGAGMASAKKSAMSLNNSIKSGVALVGSMAAAYVGLHSVKAAVDLDKQHRKLAFNIRFGNDQLMESADILKIVQDAADETGRTSEEMTAAFAEVYGATKDLEYTKAIMKDIGDAAFGAHQEVGTIAVAAQQMQRKFGISAEDVLDSMAQITEAAQQGGPNFEQLTQSIDRMGASTLQAGLKGKAGMNFILGALNATDGAMGGLGQQVSGISNMLTKLGNPGQLKNMAKTLKMKPEDLLNEKDFLGVLNKVMGKGQKGIDVLKATFIGPEEAKALKILFTDPYAEALKKAQTGGLNGQAAVDAAVAEMARSMDQFGKGTKKGSDLLKEAEKERKSPEANLLKAKEALSRAFSSPELMQGVADMSEHLPALAKMFGNVISFGAKNPILAGALGIGGKVGAGFFAGAAKSAGKAMTSSFTSSLVANGGSFGTAAREMINKGGPVFGGLAAAVMAVAITKALMSAMDSAFDKKRKKENEAIVNRAAAGSQRAPRTETERKAQLAQVNAVIKDLEGGETYADKWAQQAVGTYDQNQKYKRADYQDAISRRKELMDPGVVQPATPAAAAAALTPESTGPKTIAMDRPSAHLVAAEIVNGLRGATLDVRMATSGVVATSVSHGPRQLPATQQGGGL